MTIREIERYIATENVNNAKRLTKILFHGDWLLIAHLPKISQREELMMQNKWVVFQWKSEEETIISGDDIKGLMNIF